MPEQKRWLTLLDPAGNPIYVDVDEISSVAGELISEHDTARRTDRTVISLRNNDFDLLVPGGPRDVMAAINAARAKRG